MKQKRTTVGCPVVIAMVLACSSCDGEATRPATPEELLAERVGLARAEDACTTMISCCEQQGRQDPEICVDDLAWQFGQSLGASIIAGEVDVNEEQLAECTQWLERERTDCLWNLERPAVCDTWMTGLQGEGEPCVSAYSCAENRMCTGGSWDDDLYEGCASGQSGCRCEGFPGMGEPCAGICTDGLRCSADTRVCHRTLFIDEYCNPGERGSICGEQAFCDHENSRCAPRRGLGEVCVDSRQCESSHCEETTGTCEFEPMCRSIFWNR